MSPSSFIEKYGVELSNDIVDQWVNSNRRANHWSLHRGYVGLTIDSCKEVADCEYHVCLEDLMNELLK